MCVCENMSIFYRSLVDTGKYLILLILLVLISGAINDKLNVLSDIPSISDNPTNEELSKMLSYSRQAEDAYVSLGYSLLGYLLVIWILFIVAELATCKISRFSLTRKHVATIVFGTLLVAVSFFLVLYNPWFVLLYILLYTIYHALLYYRRTWSFLKKSDFWYAYGLYFLLTILPLFLIWYSSDNILFWLTLLVCIFVVCGRSYFRGILLHETAA